MKSRFSSRLGMLGVLGIVAAIVLSACGGASTTTTTPSATSSTGSKFTAGTNFKLGVSLSFNNTDFWTNYISY